MFRNKDKIPGKTYVWLKVRGEWVVGLVIRIFGKKRNSPLDVRTGDGEVRRVNGNDTRRA